jgi:hypothetical protein
LDNIGFVETRTSCCSSSILYKEDFVLQTVKSCSDIVEGLRVYV